MVVNICAELLAREDVPWSYKDWLGRGPDFTNPESRLSDQSQIEVPHRPLVNRFPNNDVLYDPTLDEAKALPGFHVLPDSWKFHALRLNVKKRSERWKLVFNSAKIHKDHCLGTLSVLKNRPYP